MRFDRGERRYHNRRVVAKRFRQEWVVHLDYSSAKERDEDREWTLCRARKRRDHNTRCSCPGCGTPRRHFGNSLQVLTFQERRANLALTEEV